MRRVAVVLCILVSISVQGDDGLRNDLSCRLLQMPSRAEIDDLYFALADLSLEDQRQQMWALASKTRAALWTYNIERYIRDHPELSTEARELFARGIALINTPAWFDIQEGSFGYAAKSSALADFKRDVQTILPRAGIVEAFIRLGPEPPSAPPARAENPTTGTFRGFKPESDSMFHCTCGSGFDCGSSSSYGCFDAWCIPTSAHCGWYGDESCWGKCKATGE